MRVKGIKYIVMEVELTTSGEHTMTLINDVIQNSTKLEKEIT